MFASRIGRKALLSLAVGAAVVAPNSALAAGTITLANDPTGSVSRIDGSVQVGGTATCSEPQSLMLMGSLQQRAGRFNIVHGSFSAQVACTPEGTHWTATAHPMDEPFNPGRAEMTTQAFLFDPFGSPSPQAVSEVKLTR